MLHNTVTLHKYSELLIFHHPVAETKKPLERVFVPPAPQEPPASVGKGGKKRPAEDGPKPAPKAKAKAKGKGKK